MGESIGMSALMGSTVEQTLSGVAGERTGLPGAETHEASGKDFGDLGNPLLGLHRPRVSAVRSPPFEFVGGLARSRSSVHSQQTGSKFMDVETVL